tara:strand:- start:511 stop:693 length:183 start_codon:yes stop_codon:yes gene_type:complete
MDMKKGLFKLIVSLAISPLIVYIILTIARLSGADYDMSHGDAFIIWLLMAILIKQSLFNK